jgi:hypothetical protein
MARYKVWDKREDIFTLGRDADGRARWTAAEYIADYAPWAENPNVKIIVGGGAVNGTVFMEFDETVAHYRRQGAELPDGLSDAEVLAAIEAFEDTPPEAPPDANERIAAALEFGNLLNM